MKKLLVFMLVAVMVFSLAACGGDNGKKSDAVFKVGATGPLTGEAAIYGVAVKYGAEIAVEEVNALGGVQFEFRMEDDTHDTEKADNAYNALKDWGMDFMMGSVTSSPAEVTAANAFKDRCFYLTPSASSPNVVEGKDNVFQMCFTDPNQGSSAAQFIKDNFPGKKMAVIWKNDDSYSTVIRDKFVSESKALGLEVVEDQTFTDATSTDFSVQIAKCQEAGAELVFLPMYYTPASLIFNQAKAVGYAPTWFGVDGMDGILTLEGFDTSLAEGVVVLTPYYADDTSDLNQNFVKKYEAKAGATPNQFAADAYDCIYALHKAATAAKLNPDMKMDEICDALVAQFTSMSFDGLTGKEMKWATDGTVSKKPNAVVIKDGKYTGL